MKSIEWVAGLLEGEGTFYIVAAHSASPRIACSMTDLDVLQELLESVGNGTLRPIKKRQEHWKDAWIWRVQGESAAELMEKIRPYMGARRGKKIDELLEIWYSRSKKHLGASENMSRAVDEYLSTNKSLRDIAKEFSVGKDTLNKYASRRRVDNK